jgi:hypothetical protein
MSQFMLKLKNNTDYQSGITFASKEEFTKFLGWYYSGEEGNAYAESWYESEDGGETWTEFSDDFKMDLRDRSEFWYV